MDAGAGTDNVFADFVATSYGSFVRSAFLLVGDAGQAEDLVQSALLHTLRAWDRLDSPTAYTRTTMVHLAGRWGRRRWRAERPTAVLPDERHLDAASTAESLDVRRALARLPWPQRAVLVLRYFDDLTEAQTAEVLGCSVGTVKSRASRALAALRAAGLVEPIHTEVHDG